MRLTGTSFEKEVENSAGAGAFLLFRSIKR